MTMKTPIQLFAVLSTLGASSPAVDKTLIDYFLPAPIHGRLTKEAWGAPNVLPRDPQNGLEDSTMKQWCYWDGQIIKGPDGKYHMFASRWDQAKGHGEWHRSKAVHAVSDTVTGLFSLTGPLLPMVAVGATLSTVTASESLAALPAGSVTVKVAVYVPLSCGVKPKLCVSPSAITSPLLATTCQRNA